MRRTGGFLAMAAVTLAASACAPMFNGVSVAPGCGYMQARSYHSTSTSFFNSQQRVSAIQSRYNTRSASYAGPIRGAQGWRSLASGECR
jgi:hypothetical protein